MQLRMNRKEKRELALSEVVLIILACVGLVVVVWLAWLRPQNPITSYEACVKAGNPVQLSYPSTCVTKGGKQFTNPGQQAPAPSDASVQFLTIKEWGVKFPYPSNVHALSYHLLETFAPTRVETAMISLDDIKGDCRGSNMLVRAKSGQDLDGHGRTAEQVRALPGEQNSVKRIGDYDYMFAHGQVSCTKAGEDALLQQIHDLSSGFRGDDIQKLVPTP